MFSPVVLVCAILLNQVPDNCYIFSLDTPLQTVEECNLTAKESINDGFFLYYDESSDTTFDAVKFQCLDWAKEDT